MELVISSSHLSTNQMTVWLDFAVNFGCCLEVREADHFNLHVNLINIKFLLQISIESLMRTCY